MEIYCERVKDLLNPKSQGNLRVRWVHAHYNSHTHIHTRTHMHAGTHTHTHTPGSHTLCYLPLPPHTHHSQRASLSWSLRRGTSQAGSDLLRHCQVPHGRGEQGQVRGYVSPRRQSDFLAVVRHEMLAKC